MRNELSSEANPLYPLCGGEVAVCWDGADPLDWAAKWKSDRRCVWSEVGLSLLGELRPRDRPHTLPRSQRQTCSFTGSRGLCLSALLMMSAAG